MKGLTLKTGGLWTLLALLAILGYLFSPSFQPGQAHFSNDGPLGVHMMESRSLPEGFTGRWHDLNWVGEWVGNASPSITSGLLWLLGPVAFAKYYPPLTLLILGLSAWLFFRILGLHPIVCLLGGLAATLNTAFFSHATWGLGSHTLAVAMTFLALAALTWHPNRHAWMSPFLAGAAVGMGVMEAYDTGAILSLLVAVFAVWQAWKSDGPIKQRLWVGARRLALVVVSAVLIAIHTLSTLVATQVQGIEGMNQESRTKQERWDWATQWSLPKKEAFRTIIPGLFGYRMDTPDGGEYWGGVGRTPGWEEHQQGQPRHSGAGFYAGVFVVLVAVWGVGQATFSSHPPFSPAERRWIWFWAAVTLVSLLLAFGRHFFLYQFFYAIPYFSTIRNPIKFLHPYSIGWVVLFGYGVAGLYRHYLAATTPNTTSVIRHLKDWWPRASKPERNSTLTVVGALLTGLLAWLIYAAARPDLLNFLQNAGFDSDQAASIASFSVGQFGWFILFLAIGAAAMVLILSGFLAGRRCWIAFLLVGGILVADLARANTPWIVHYDYEEKYASDPVIDFLKEKPHQSRVKVIPARLLRQLKDVSRETVYRGLQLQQFYQSEWLQHQFRYYNIQSLDIVQEPRLPEDKADFQSVFPPDDLQAQLWAWQLTNTRLLLAPNGEVARALDDLTEGSSFFNLIGTFQFVQDGEDGPIKAQWVKNGPFGLFHFHAALPRALLMPNWEVIPNRQQTLKRLGSPSFNPAETVLINREVPGTDAEEPTAPEEAGNVRFIDYSPKEVRLAAEVNRPAILLLNDKYHPKWQVTVNGEPTPLLRANFLMRGVFLEPGNHTVTFRFQAGTAAFAVGLIVLATVLGVCTFLLFGRHPHRAREATGEAAAATPPSSTSDSARSPNYRPSKPD